MICSLDDLRRKEVIDITNGDRLGYIDDIEINLDTSEVEALIIYGRMRFFGLFGKDDNVIIPCDDIKVVGKETVLVRLTFNKKTSKSTNNHEFALKSLLK